MILSIREGLTSLYYRLIRGKLLQQHMFGQPTWTSRLLHLGPLYGFIFAAPALATVAWYAGLAVSSHYRHDSATKSGEPLTLEVFQLHLHDRLSADFRRLNMPEPQPKSELPTLGLVLNNDKLSRLEQMLPPVEGQGSYVDALMQHKNKLYEIELRYRGAKPWHWNNPQKSWKVRVKGNHVMFEGLPTFNFINTPDPMPFNEQMVLDTAREAGLLTPAYYPFRLLINNGYLGVYFFEGQPDEGLLRRERRMPGSIYSGAGAPINPVTKVSSLWEASANWKKVGEIADRAKLDTKELDALLKVVKDGTFEEFATFAEEALDVNKFATFDAIDVVFGNNQHDYHQNHKLYFDPYKNRFEPIATDFRDMEHEREFNRTENPLVLRLKTLPDYLTLRNRKVYELLGSTCSENALKERVDHWIERLRPDQSRDPYWDAYELLPVMGTYYRQLVRPMNEERQSNAAVGRLTELRERASYLRSEIERQDVQVRLYLSDAPVATVPVTPGKGKPLRRATVAPVEAPGFHAAVLDISVNGQAGYYVAELMPEADKDCSPTEWQLYADRDLDQRFVEGKDLRLAAVEAPLKLGKPDITLQPGVALKEIPLHPYRGRVLSEPEPRTYRFFLRSKGCLPSHWRLEGRNAATQAALTLHATVNQQAVPVLANNCDQSSGFMEPGRSAPHPFCLPFIGEDTVRLGPGVVDIEETRVYRANQTVIIEPGTTLRMAAGASLITYGRLMAEGQQAMPIRIVPATNTWGGLALQGMATAGSRLSYVEVERGTRPVRGFFDFPGMVNLHDTRDIRLDHLRVASNQGSDDALHVAYVQDLTVTDSRFEHTFADAIDLEYSLVKIERTVMVDAGDDCLDLMGTRVVVVDSQLLHCKGNGISAGERSDVLLQRSLVAQCVRGLLVKNASSINGSESLLYQNQVAIRQEAETEWYPGSSSLSVDNTYAVGAQTMLDGLKKPKSGSLKTALGQDDLPSLRQLLLGEGDWSELEAQLAAQKAGSAP